MFDAVVGLGELVGGGRVVVVEVFIGSDVDVVGFGKVGGPGGDVGGGGAVGVFLDAEAGLAGWEMDLRALVIV